jgi:hypothetical protein
VISRAVTPFQAGSDRGRRLDWAVGPARNLFPVFFQLQSGLRQPRSALAFSIWLYWTGFLVLIGAQFNAELLQQAKGRSAPSRTIRET